ncbi:MULTISPECIES: antitoxin [Mycolicibacterium]|uniref:Antitoxin/MT0933 n=1 Tax=Mycolicibacterium neoaurum TaxID=1795 RepID=A0AAV2WME9_MYCNE|nr:antitoxin [Mycolicibacterium neoaurum]QVI29233.1 antitoxin [Mycolicibacterium neoaurum]TLH57240.1 antitoxin [Mycolicibacterium neoaurum]CDQ45374.1 Antitoxin/MT0933 [Mycolicibacterium neoaurum]SDC45560.1 MT0933-like antitoxin protein [Mycolicibacterium neoaurum]
MSFLDKIKGLVAKNTDKVDTVIEKAGDLVDKKTQGKYAQHVDKVQEAAKKAAREHTGAEQPPQVPPNQQSGQPPAGSPPPPAAP